VKRLAFLGFLIAVILGAQAPNVASQPAASTSAKSTTAAALSPAARTAALRATLNPRPHGACSTCMSIDNFGLTSDTSSSSGAANDSNVVFPSSEVTRLSAVNEQLFEVLQRMTKKDPSWITQYKAAEAQQAHSMTDQLAMRSMYLKNLVDKMYP
jgi:hypothetical protein